MRLTGHLGPKTSPYYRGAVIFRDHCSGCHTLSTVGAEGSATSIKDRLRTNGPNFNFRKENRGTGALRDPQRRLLGRDHAGEHRPRHRSARSRQLPAQYSGLQAQKVPTTNITLSTKVAEPSVGFRVLDLKRIRQEPDAVRAALERRGREAAAGLEPGDRAGRAPARAAARAGGVCAPSRTRRTRASSPRRSRRSASGEIAAMRGVAARAKELERELARSRRGSSGALAPLPNLPDPTAAPGPEDELVREVGEIPTFDFEPRDHLELAGEGIDMDRAARLSGSRFAYLKGDLVMLELALVRWVLEKLRGKGFEPVIPPVLVREQALYGTGFLPDTEQQIYSLPRGRAVPRRHLRGRARVAARRGDPGRREPAAALRRLLALLPPRGRRGGERHARDLPRAPVRQGGDVQLRLAGGVRSPSTSGSSRSRRRSSRSWACATAS